MAFPGVQGPALTSRRRNLRDTICAIICTPGAKFSALKALGTTLDNRYLERVWGVYSVTDGGLFARRRRVIYSGASSVADVNDGPVVRLVAIRAERASSSATSSRSRLALSNNGRSRSTWAALRDRVTVLVPTFRTQEG